MRLKAETLYILFNIYYILNIIYIYYTYFMFKKNENTLRWLLVNSYFSI